MDLFYKFDHYKYIVRKNVKKYKNLSNFEKKKFIDNLFLYYDKTIPIMEFSKPDVDFCFDNLLKEQNYTISTNCVNFDEFKKYKLFNLINFVKNTKHKISDRTEFNFLNCNIIINDEDEKKNWYKINSLSYFYNVKELLKCRVNYHQDANTYFVANYYKLFDEYFSKLDRYHEDGFLIHKLTFSNNNDEYKKAINVRLFYDILSKYNKLCTIFKPYLFKLLINIFKPKDIKPTILDLSSGWGDRLIASICLEEQINKYIGIDPNSNLFKGYKKMINDYAKDSNKFKLIESPSEIVDYKKLNEEIDIIFWSPPFSVQEHYITDTFRDDYKLQSTNKYKEYNEWEDKFLIKTINESTKILKKNGILILYLGAINFDSFFKKMEKINHLKYVGVINIKVSKVRYHRIFIKV